MGSKDKRTKEKKKPKKVVPKPLPLRPLIPTVPDEGSKDRQN